MAFAGLGATRQRRTNPLVGLIGLPVLAAVIAMEAGLAVKRIRPVD